MHVKSAKRVHKFDDCDSKQIVSYVHVFFQLWTRERQVIFPNEWIFPTHVGLLHAIKNIDSMVVARSRVFKCM